MCSQLKSVFIILLKILTYNCFTVVVSSYVTSTYVIAGTCGQGRLPEETDLRNTDIIRIRAHNPGKL